MVRGHPIHNCKEGALYLYARLEWPTEITETVFFKRIRQMPGAKTRIF